MQERVPAPIYTGFDDVTEAAPQPPPATDEDDILGAVTERAPPLPPPPQAEQDSVLGEVMERDRRPLQAAGQDVVLADVAERAPVQPPHRGGRGCVTFADDVRGGDDEVCSLKMCMDCRRRAATHLVAHVCAADSGCHA